MKVKVIKLGRSFYFKKLKANLEDVYVVLKKLKNMYLVYLPHLECNGWIKSMYVEEILE